jgi:GDP-4-dehydro-6-deoxy-D-mannose reductase
MRVLTTGATGFAGGFLSEHLIEKGIEVYGTSLSSQDSSSLAQIKKLDLLDKKATEELLLEIKPDVIFHLAALTSPAESFNDPEKIITNNIIAEINILEAVRKNNISCRIMITSTAEVYGLISEKDLPVDEETPLNPGSPYAVSKIAQDFLGLQYFNAYGMDVVRIRPFNHIGPRQTTQFVVASFAKQIAEIEKKISPPLLKVGNLDAKRDFTDVRDMVRAYTLLSEKGRAGEVYNIGSGKSHKIGEILDRLLSLSKVKIDVELDPARLRPSDVPDIYSDNKKIEEETGWKPEIPLEKTLEDTLDYWRQSV